MQMAGAADKVLATPVEYPSSACSSPADLDLPSQYRDLTDDRCAMHDFISATIVRRR